MPQRIHSVPTVQPFSAPANPVDSRAIARIKSSDANREWETMNWYDGLAQKDLQSISSGDFLNLQEELVALARTLYLHNNPEPPKRLQIKRLQLAISRHLSELLERGQTTFAPFKIVSWVVCLKKAASIGGMPALPPGLPDIFTWDTVRPKTPSQLVETSALHKFNQLLKQHAGSIGRCAHCDKIFLQFRRNAHYCNRQCQSVAAMRAIRARKKQKKAGSKRAHLKGSRAQRKESKHG